MLNSITAQLPQKRPNVANDATTGPIPGRSRSPTTRGVTQRFSAPPALARNSSRSTRTRRSGRHRRAPTRHWSAGCRDGEAQPPPLDPFERRLGQRRWPRWPPAPGGRTGYGRLRSSAPARGGRRAPGSSPLRRGRRAGACRGPARRRSAALGRCPPSVTVSDTRAHSPDASPGPAAWLPRRNRGHADYDTAVPVLDRPHRAPRPRTCPRTALAGGGEMAEVFAEDRQTSGAVLDDGRVEELSSGRDAGRRDPGRRRGDDRLRPHGRSQRGRPAGGGGRGRRSPGRVAAACGRWPCGPPAGRGPGE